MKPTDEQLSELARMLKATVDQEIDCAEFLDRVAPYLGKMKRRTELTEELQQVAQHLDICPECQEEFTALLKAEGIDPKALQ